MGKAYRIGTVEALKVKRSGRRFYLNLDTVTVDAFGIQVGDVLKVAIKLGIRSDNSGTRPFPKSVASHKNEEEENNGE